MTKKHPLRGTRKQFRDGFASFTARLGMGQDNQLAKSGYVAEGYVISFTSCFSCSLSPPAQ